jgi:hypothetical protein
MAHYYVNQHAQANGDHEVHKSGCSHMPKDKTSLGDHATCSSAVATARQHYSKVDGCAFCSPGCHKR